MPGNLPPFNAGGIPTSSRHSTDQVVPQSNVLIRQRPMPEQAPAVDLEAARIDPTEYTPFDPTDQVVPTATGFDDEIAGPPPVGRSPSPSGRRDEWDDGSGSQGGSGSDSGSSGSDSEGGGSDSIPDEVYDDPAWDTSSSSGDDGEPEPTSEPMETESPPLAETPETPVPLARSPSLIERVDKWIQSERALGHSDYEIEGMIKNMKLQMDNVLFDPSMTPTTAMDKMISDIRGVMSTDAGTAEGLARGYISSQYSYLKDDFGIEEGVAGSGVADGAGELVLGAGELAAEEGALETAETEEGLASYEALGESLAEETEVATEMFVELILL